MGTLGGKELSNRLLSSSILVFAVQVFCWFWGHVSAWWVPIGSQGSDFGRSIIWQEYWDDFYLCFTFFWTCKTFPMKHSKVCQLFFINITMQIYGCYCRPANVMSNLILLLSMSWDFLQSKFFIKNFVMVQICKYYFCMKLWSSHAW